MRPGSDDLPKMLAAVMLILALVVSANTTGTAKEEEGEGLSFIYVGVVERVEKGLGPSGEGGPVQMMYDAQGERVLLRGHGHTDELRVMNGDLDTLAVLEPPFEDFAVSGATITQDGRWVMAWGRTPFNDTDVLAVYNLTDHRLYRDHIPEGTIPLEEIDDVDLLGGGAILVVAGRDGDGTDRISFIETLPMVELKNDTVPGDASVVSVGTDGVVMVVVLDDGSLLIYQTFDWALETTYQVFDGPFTAYEIKEGSDWHFGSAEGEVVGISYYQGLHFQNMTASRGPVLDVFSVEFYQHQVVAVPGEENGTRLEVWMYSRTGLEIESATEIGDTVVSLVGDPSTNNTFAACMDDGSVEYYRVKVVEEPLPPREPSWGDVYGKPVGLTGSALLGVVVLLLVLWRRRVREKDRG